MKLHNQFLAVFVFALSHEYPILYGRVRSHRETPDWKITEPIIAVFSIILLRRHVILPKELAKTLPKTRLLSEAEWRGIGVQQSRGWHHYAIHT